MAKKLEDQIYPIAKEYKGPHLIKKPNIFFM